VSDRVSAVLLVIVLTALTVAAVIGNNDPFAGRVLFRVTGSHGVHLGDLLFVASWAVGVACCWRLWRRGEN
jgi:hypothetical protein